MGAGRAAKGVLRRWGSGFAAIAVLCSARALAQPAPPPSASAAPTASSAAPPAAPTAAPPTAPSAAPPPAPPAAPSAAPPAPAQPQYPYPYAPYPYPYAYPYPYPYPYAQPAAAPPRPRPPPKPEIPPQWILTVDLGMAFAAPSDEKTLLEDDGYALGPAFLLGADFSWFFAEHVGLGAWGAWTNSTDTPKNGGPELIANDYFAGGELSLTFGTSDVRVLLRPRLGVGFGTLDLGGPSSTKSAFAWGGAVSVLFPRAFVGFSMGFTRASVGPPGELARDYNLGATYIAFTGVFSG